ncbi:MAG: DUF1775 domain-containing protein, partial [Ilumatobacteraceae bacterium]
MKVLRQRFRYLAGAAITAAIVAATSTAAFAHSGFDLDEVAPGSIVALHLKVANESRTAGTTRIELRFPQPIVIFELPTEGEWTATPVDGTVGSEATGIVWERPTAPIDENPSVALTLGPLPAEEGRLQFKVLQTYSDGTEDAWISEWPVGAEEPDMPGPVLDLVTGAAGTIPPDTTTPATVAPTATATPVFTATTIEPTIPSTDPPVTTTTTSPDEENGDTTTVAATIDANDNDDESSDTGLIIGIVAVAVVGVAAGIAV